MNSSVIVFPGSNCDRDISVALSKNKFQNKMIWHNDVDLPKSDLVVLPGGFSYGDYLRSGSIAAKSKIMNSVINHAKNGGLLLGICNGFQILVESNLLPGVLLRNRKLKFISRDVYVKTTNQSSKFCNKYKEISKFPIAHNEGSYYADKNTIKKLEEKDLIAFKYCDNKGNVNEISNPNGSLNNIAGILNENQNILGMMPHPERMIEEKFSGNDGSVFFNNLLNNIVK